MFENIEGKLKTFAGVNAAFGIIAAIICVIGAPMSGLYWFLVVGAIMLLMSLIQAFFIYAFAEILENTSSMKRTLMDSEEKAKRTIDISSKIFEVTEEINRTLKSGCVGEMSSKEEQGHGVETERGHMEQQSVITGNGQVAETAGRMTATNYQAEQPAATLAGQERIERYQERHRATADTKEGRIELYWEKHQEEKAALLEKKAAAEKALLNLGAFSGTRRKELQNLVSAIGEELTKDRSVDE